MSTNKDTVARILEQLEPLDVRARAMFGEYGLYCDEKVVGLICGDVLYVKPTEISAEFGSDADLAPPYPGAKEYTGSRRSGFTTWIGCTHSFSEPPTRFHCPRRSHRRRPNRRSRSNPLLAEIENCYRR
jgi:hypothetical protein